MINKQSFVNDEVIYASVLHYTILGENQSKCIQNSDQYQYLGNGPPTPPLTQQQSIDNKFEQG